jgi:palmitoyltransferase
MFVFSVIGYIYYTVMFLEYIPRIQTAQYPPIHEISYLIAFNICVFMLNWCLIKAMITDPGEVPPYWGFYMGNPEHMRRRYCLMCHVFKPERCHHCSACNRCVLNMDHHCPWINNCVGFYNRKFFMLLLMYVLITTYMVAFGMYQRAFEVCQTVWRTHLIVVYPDTVIVTAYVMNCMLAVTMTFFFKFHVKLVMKNSTTIENLDRRNIHRDSNYDMGSVFNWMQVFGKNPWLWVLPITGKSGKPLGDGVDWNQNAQLALDEEVPVNETEGMPQSMAYRNMGIKNVQSPTERLKAKAIAESLGSTIGHNADAPIKVLVSNKLKQPEGPGRSESPIDGDYYSEGA